MDSTFITQSHLIILLQILCFTAAQTSINNFPIFRCQKNTTSTIYQTNIETALASVSAAVATHYGFSKTSVGESQNTVTAAALCRGDIGLNTCKDCISNSLVQLRHNCSNKIEAIIWSSNCSLLYSNRTQGTSTYFNRPDAKLLSHVNTSNVDDFGAALRNLTARLRPEAAAGNSLRKFATGDVVFGPEDSSKIYALMQCSPDLSSSECISCLSVVFNEAQNCCDGDIDVAVFFRNCHLRYSNVSFYNDPPEVSLPAISLSPASSPATPGGRKRNSSKTIKVIIFVASFCIGLVFSVGLWFLVIKARLKNRATDGSASSTDLIMVNDSAHLTQTETVEMEMGLGMGGSLQFDLGTIVAATNNFFIQNKIGEGGFGPVYKGVLANGTEVAVKRLSKSSGQGSREFVNEVILMAKLQHRNLVRLLGFCLADDEKLLIYEYVSNKSLDYFLFDPNMHEHLDWPKRHRIIEGITRGMLYLHQDSRLRIIHRDLKASNILLDMDMNAKISDFGLARIVGADQTQGSTNRIVGTYGYMSPEYAVHGHFSIKSDVFAFGVIVLEIITGKKSSSFLYQDDIDDLPNFAWRNWKDGKKMELVDPTLVETCSKDEVMRCISIGLLCVQEDVDARPSMTSVFNMLNNYSIALSSPKRPPHYFSKRHSSYFSTIKSDIFRSNYESSITGIHPR